MRGLLAASTIALSLALTPCPAAAATESAVIARAADGTEITTSAVSTYGRLIGSTYADPVDVYRNSSDEAVRRDAFYFVERAVREIAWLRRVTPLARAAGFEMAAVDRDAVREALDGCITAKFQTELMAGVTTVTMEDARRIIASIPELAPRPETREVAYIFLSTSSTLAQQRPDSVREKMEQIRQQVLQGSLTFGEAARRHSEAPSAAQNGHVGAVTRQSRMNPGFLGLVFSTPARSVSPPTLLHNGYYMVNVERVVPAVAHTIEDILTSPPLASLVLGTAQQETMRRVLAEITPLDAPTSEAVSRVARAALDRGTTAPECAEMVELMELRAIGMAWFINTAMQNADPSEEEITRFYENHPSEMMEEGQWRITMFRVPVDRRPGSAVPTLERATKVATTAREALLRGEDDDRISAGFGQEGLRVTSSTEWLRSSDVGPIDMEFVGAEPGVVSAVATKDDAAVFARLDARRVPGKLPLAAKRDYIVSVLRTMKTEHAMLAAMDETSRTLKLTILP